MLDRWTVSVSAGVGLVCLLGMTGNLHAATRLHDPTEPETTRAVSMAVNRTAPRLEMILSGAARKIAVINGQELAVGDRGEGFVVRAIDPDKVHILMTGRRSGDREMTLRLKRMAKELRP